MKNAETRGRQIDIVLSESDMEIFGGFLIFEIPESRYSKIVIFESFRGKFATEKLEENIQFIIQKQFSMIIN